jgi:TonB family protein
LQLCRFSCTIAEAQTTPPLFQGSDDVQLFRQALMERVTEVYYSDGYTPDDLIHYFWMNFTIDTLGRCIDLEIPDTCRRQTIIVKERTLELLRTALAGIDSFQPATERGEKVPSRQTMEYDFAYIPEVITLACFKKSEPNDFTALQRYIAKRVEYPEELRPWGVSGRVSVTFIVDADGSVKIDKVLESPHPKMSYRVKKIILSTSGKWTPATYFGVPIQQRFNIPVDFRLR